MSTKLYNGYKLPAMSAPELLAFCQRVKAKMEAAKQISLYQMLGRSLAHGFDLALAQDKPLTGVRQTIFKELSERIEETKKGYRDPSVDFECSATFFPMKTKTLVLFWSNKKEFLQAWGKTREVKDYHYQNQTDRPANLTADAWRARKQDWDKVLLRYNPSIPSLNGFTFEFTESFISYQLELVLKYMPSFQDRIAIIASDLLFQDYCQQQQVALNANNIGRTFMEFGTWKKTAAGKLALKQKQMFLKAKLPRKYQLAQLQS